MKSCGSKTATRNSQSHDNQFRIVLFLNTVYIDENNKQNSFLFYLMVVGCAPISLLSLTRVCSESRVKIEQGHMWSRIHTPTTFRQNRCFFCFLFFYRNFSCKFRVCFIVISTEKSVTFQKRFYYENMDFFNQERLMFRDRCFSHADRMVRC